MSVHTVIVQTEERSRRGPVIRFATPRWSPRRFDCDQPANCPLIVEHPQRWLWVSLGLGVGVWCFIGVAVKNRSSTAIHSFALRFLTEHNSGIGVQPERPLLPGEAERSDIQETNPDCAGVRVDFVQFVTADVWCRRDPYALVTEAGLAAGSAAAVRFLQSTAERLGAEAILPALSRIHVDVVGPMTETTFGPFGYYAGVTRVAVAVQSAFDRRGLDEVVGWLGAPHFGG
jgi:hypothetical protein